MACSSLEHFKTYSENPASDISLRINPQTGVPLHRLYFLQLRYKYSQINLIGYQGSWTRVGAANFSDTRTYTLDLVFNNTGTPYISFIETPGGVKEGFRNGLPTWKLELGRWRFLFRSKIFIICFKYRF